MLSRQKTIKTEVLTRGLELKEEKEDQKFKGKRCQVLVTQVKQHLSSLY